MGQQQLLLVILVTIIVGIATVVAINTFSSASDNANVDAVTNDIVQIASSAQSYYMKPAMMGGGGNTFDNMEFQDLTFPGTVNSITEGVNANGTYTLSNVGGQTFTITAVPATAGGSATATVGKDGITSSGVVYTGS